MNGQLFHVPPLSSCGIILSRQCTNECRHCLFASSPEWKDWIPFEALRLLLQEINKNDRYLTGIHFSGGEPFIRPELLLAGIRFAGELGLPVDYAETNAFWCFDEKRTRQMMMRLRENGLPGLTIDVSPFHIEFIPMNRIQSALKVGSEVFGPDRVQVSSRYFYGEFLDLEPDQTLPFEDYLVAVGEEKASLMIASELGLVAGGRAAERLHYLYVHREPEAYFGETCSAELSNPHHVHVDCYGNYMPGFCAGITLGSAFRLTELYQRRTLDPHPVLSLLAQGGVEFLYRQAVSKWGYRARPDGYIAKCHLCLDIRRHLVRQGCQLPELAPLEFYSKLDET
jgi:hypothetical protein